MNLPFVMGYVLIETKKAAFSRFHGIYAFEGTSHELIKFCVVSHATDTCIAGVGKLPFLETLTIYYVMEQ